MEGLTPDDITPLIMGGHHQMIQHFWVLRRAQMCDSTTIPCTLGGLMPITPDHPTREPHAPALQDCDLSRCHTTPAPAAPTLPQNITAANMA